MFETLIPFHKQAEDVGTFLAQERAREAKRSERPEPIIGPSENTD
ncbi:MAG TPA: hypothetical protein VMU39_18740 [Solirubrobacteraceae bacterium]|nr:hypothetical protein [Solirubrobacteraceae bacterium]